MYDDFQEFEKMHLSAKIFRFYLFHLCMTDKYASHGFSFFTLLLNSIECKFYMQFKYINIKFRPMLGITLMDYLIDYLNNKTTMRSFQQSHFLIFNLAYLAKKQILQTAQHFHNTCSWLQCCQHIIFHVIVL